MALREWLRVSTGLATPVNRALHEARRPLQLLALRDAAPVEVAQIADALDEIEAIVNRRRRRSDIGPTDVGRLVAGTAARLRATPLAAGRMVNVRVAAPSPLAIVDRRRFAGAVENLIVNALEHGHGPVEVEVAAEDGAVTVAVANAVAQRGLTRADPDLRHGHGLEIIAAAARRAGGRFTFSRDGAGVLATLALDPASPAA